MLHAAHIGEQRWSRDKVKQRRKFLQCGDEGSGSEARAALGPEAVSIEGDNEVAWLKVSSGLCG